MNHKGHVTKFLHLFTITHAHTKRLILNFGELNEKHQGTVVLSFEQLQNKKTKNIFFWILKNFWQYKHVPKCLLFNCPKFQIDIFFSSGHELLGKIIRNMAT